MDARITTTDPALNLRLCLAGGGLNMSWESWAGPHIEAGALVPVLEEYSPPFPGFYLYFPHRRQRSAALEAFIDYVRYPAQCVPSGVQDVASNPERGSDRTP